MKKSNKIQTAFLIIWLFTAIAWSLYVHLFITTSPSAQVQKNTGGEFKNAHYPVKYMQQMAAIGIYPLDVPVPLDSEKPNTKTSH